MNATLLYGLLIIHLVTSILYAILIITRRSSHKSRNILPILLIPLFGPIAALLTDILNAFTKGEKKPVELQTLGLSEDIYWKTIKRREEEKNIVPLEDALVLNNRGIRRKLMLDTLLDDPMRYLDVLMLARDNDDIDTAHYANTTIAKIQREFQLKIQQLAVEYERDPDGVKILDQYIDTTGKYIESGLADAYLLQRQRLMFAELLQKKLALEPHNKEILIKKIRNSIALNNLTSAFEASEMLKQSYPENEQSWIETLRVCLAAFDEKRLKETVSEIRRRDIDWIQTGREQVSAWIMGI